MKPTAATLQQEFVNVLRPNETTDDILLMEKWTIWRWKKDTALDIIEIDILDGADPKRVSELLHRYINTWQHELSYSIDGLRWGQVLFPEEEESAAPPEEPHNSDMGNATRLARRHGKDLRYCPPLGGWMAWNGQLWEPGADLQVMAWAKETVLHMYTLLPDIIDTDKRAGFAKHCAYSEHVSRLNAMVSLARSEPGIEAVTEDFDSDHWLLNVQNGVLDLRTVELRPFDRKLLITKQASVTYDPQATCSRWEQFMSEIMDEKDELIGFLQRALGLSLTGDVSDDVLFILWGGGENGKTTFITVVNAILGNGYARTTPAATLMAKRNEGVRNDIARLKGARFVSAIEGEKGRRLAESLVKALTGGDRQASRFLYSEYFEYDPTFKIWLATNHKPEIKGTDHAIWRRIRLVPFTVTIPKDKQVPRTELVAQLLQESSGILNWMLDGLRTWQADGLGYPEPVAEATRAYRAEMDAMAGFFDECCIFEADAKEQAGPLYTAYKDWCQANGERPESSRAFSDRLFERGLNREKDGRHRYYIGIKLRSDEVSFEVGGEKKPGPEPKKKVEHLCNYWGKSHRKYWVRPTGEPVCATCRPPSTKKQEVFEL
jgi:putative DNA primase/helicase